MPYKDIQKRRESAARRRAVWRLRHPEQVKAENKKFREQNPNYASNWNKTHKEECRIMHREWAKKNVEKCRAKVRKYRLAHPEIAKEYYLKNKEKINARHQATRLKNPEVCKQRWRKYKYGITLEQYQEKLKNQDGKCAICLKEMNPPGVDHDHATNRVRDLLCGHCNRGLGHFFDNPDLMNKAILYLQKHSVSS